MFSLITFAFKNKTEEITEELVFTVMGRAKKCPFIFLRRDFTKKALNQTMEKLLWAHKTTPHRLGRCVISMF